MSNTLRSMFERLNATQDTLSRVLMEARLGGVLTSRTWLRPPFGLSFGETKSRAGFHLALSGACWILHEHGAPARFNAGDLVVFPHGAAHVLADDPTTAPTSVETLAVGLSPDGRVALPFGTTGPETEVLCGAYDISMQAVPLLHGLPVMMLITAAQMEGTSLPVLLKMLATEAITPEQGSAMAQNRLVDLIFVQALRFWMFLQQGRPESWIAALGDSAIGGVMRSIHADPGKDWTVDRLAIVAGQSRAVFAKRFRAATGETPLSYVTNLRMAQAAQELGQGARIAEVAGRSGYQNDFAFAKAFKRVRGVTPGAARRNLSHRDK